MKKLMKIIKPVTFFDENEAGFINIDVKTQKLM